MTDLTPTTKAELVPVMSTTELLMQAAIDKGQDVREIVTLLREERAHNAKQAYFEALSALQNDAPAAPKSAEAKIVTKAGGKYGYTYAPLDGIVKHLKPYLDEHGFSYAFTAEPLDGGRLLNVICTAHHKAGHSESAAFPAPTGTDAAMSGAQKMGAALTYARRQSLLQVFGVVTSDEDPDAPREPEGPKVSENQVLEIEARLVDNDMDAQRFRQHMDVVYLRDIPAARFDEAMRAIDNVLANREKKQ